MTNNKISGFLGICRKAGKLVMGFDMTVDAMQKCTAEMVLLTSDCSERTARNMKRIAVDTETPIYILPLTMDEISYAVAKRAGVFAVCDSGFANKIKQLLETATA